MIVFIVASSPCAQFTFNIFQIERITTLTTTFLLLRRLLLFKILSTYQRTYTDTHIRPFVTKHLLLACSLLFVVWIFMSIWSCKHFSKCIKKINPEVFFLFFSLASMFAYFAFYVMYAQVHSESIISFLWRYIIINECIVRFFRHVNFIIAYKLIKNVCSRLYSIDV